jgi:predicted transcriptional regulator of viral defense system
MTASVEVVWNGTLERAFVIAAQRQSGRESLYQPLRVRDVRTYLEARPGQTCSLSDMAAALGAQRHSVCRAIHKMRPVGAVERVGRGLYRWRTS